ncbi:hypothetical protein AKJ47_02610 [candidate division MSBL1 archaeon SCGC-AAA261G05]|uniref:ATP-grasp domain-containing protein n=2 Tax=candidate division MSBL1 TaxID=215777 RepID=A0A133V139_9EURY|nr:hypothetical protein AKJ42_01510 [candidate division MSBL1 archaeon SCGC-AAA261C02]KXB03247.1 hypothetical protein AKJ47_02610 [candidate division MSBL1 archaeon SCGC-AAA261G05]
MTLNFPLNTILVAGVYTRPIVESVKKLGLNAIAVDYFGDYDLAKTADDLFSVSELKRKDKPEEATGEILFKLTQEALEVHDVDAVLLSSGMEHYPENVKRLEKRTELIGNKSSQLSFCRDKERIFDTADELGIPHPPIKLAQTTGRALRVAEDIGYPVVLKTPQGGGGIGVRLASSPEELETHFEKLAPRRGGVVYVQPYIRGVDASASVLSNGSEAKCLTVNRQIIGDERLGVPRRFGFCGNIVPLATEREYLSQIAEYSQMICSEIGLVGSNGVDFVISEDGPYLVEINPRFQNSFDLVERALNINLVEEHFLSSRGKLNIYGKPNNCHVKLIIYARQGFRTPDLTRFRNVVDIPWEDSIVERRKPICSVIKSGEDRRKTIREAYELAGKIQNFCQSREISSSPISPS